VSRPKPIDAATAKAAKTLAILEKNLRDAKNVKAPNTGKNAPHKPDAGADDWSWTRNY
jgi:hypothetical protein